MEQKDKQLLLVDLCARLPYGVRFKTPDHDKEVLQNIDTNGEILINASYDIDEVKLYLRPMSSMTKEEDKIFTSMCAHYYSEKVGGVVDVPYLQCYDWLYSRHFDIRGLIKKGLAIEAPKGMYKFE